MKLPMDYEDPQYLEPDERDFFLASHNTLKSCPFCGNTSSIARGRLNRSTGIYGYVVECTTLRCMASVFANANTREEARNAAIEQWQRRHEQGCK